MPRGEEAWEAGALSAGFSAAAAAGARFCLAGGASSAAFGGEFDTDAGDGAAGLCTCMGDWTGTGDGDDVDRGVSGA